MGGSGSGNRWQSGKGLTSSYRMLDVRQLQRKNLLQPGRRYGWQWSIDGEVTASIQIQVEHGRIILNYRTRDYGGEWEQKDYPVYLDYTACHFGGNRPWFRCPARGCGKRVAILYGGNIFACRHCYHLAYPSQREATSDRFSRRAETIRKKLGWQPGTLNPDGDKPKRMRWDTYWRLKDEHDWYAEQSLILAFARFGADLESLIGEDPLE